jgi:signal transduction histidine kinase
MDASVSTQQLFSFMTMTTGGGGDLSAFQSGGHAVEDALFILERVEHSLQLFACNQAMQAFLLRSFSSSTLCLEEYWPEPLSKTLYAHCFVALEHHCPVQYKESIVNFNLNESRLVEITLIPLLSQQPRQLILGICKDKTQATSQPSQLQLAVNFEATLKRITDKVRDSLDEDQILQAVVKELCLALKAWTCNTAIYDLEKRVSTVRYEYTDLAYELYGRILNMDTSAEIYQQLLDGIHLQYCPMLTHPAYGRVVKFACPIADEHGVLGDLWLTRSADTIFSEPEIRLTQQVVNQCAIAIRQSRLYQTAQLQVLELERLNRLKDDFVSRVSHELRTPLTTLRMALRMMHLATTEDKKNTYYTLAVDQCEKQIRLISDLLDLQQLEEREYQLCLETVDINTWILAVVAPLQSQVQHHCQELRVELPPKRVELRTDPLCLGRILRELLENAIKYTDSKKTEAPKKTDPKEVISLRVIPQKVGLFFEICNPGEIKASEIPRIFERFYRVDQPDRWKHGGTGLGLALVKQWVARLKGTIHAQSQGGWVTFTLWIPTLEVDG